MLYYARSTLSVFTHDKSIPMNALDRYAFEDRKTAIGTIYWANFFLAIPCLFNNLPSVFQHPQLQWSLVTGLAFLVLHYQYNWRSRQKNAFILGGYVFLLIAELLISGLPDNGMDIAQDVRKGVMVDVVMAGAPYVYGAAKLLLVIPLLQMVWSRSNTHS